MSIAEYLTLFYTHVGSAIICIIASIIIYYILYKSYWVSLLDPFTFMLLASCMGLGVVLFLWVSGEIKPIYFESYIITQIAFYFGFRLGHKSNKKLIFSKKVTRIVNIEEYTKLIFISATILDIVSQLLQYKILGIPLFQKSRLDIMANAGGAGIFMRIIEVCRSMAILMSFFYLSKGASKGLFRMYIKSYLLLVCGFLALSGSRSSFLIFATSFFFYACAMAANKPKILRSLKSKETIIILLLTITAVIINIIKFGNVQLAVSEFGIRLMAYGDVYFYAYPNDLILEVESSRPFQSIFSSFLGFFRIIPYESLPKPIGQELFEQFSTSGDIGGPNARHNVVSYLYFGIFGGLIFSYLLGFLSGYIRNRFLFHKHKGILKTTIISIVYSSSCTIESDISSFIFNINSFIVVIPLLIIMSTFLYCLHITYLNRAKYAKNTSNCCTVQ